MTLLVLERRFDPPLTSRHVVDMANAGAWCFQQYRVHWRGSLLAADGRTMVCQFESGDAESIRQVLRTLDADMSMLWPATVHEVANPRDPNVVVERSFDEPCDLAELQAREDSKQWCLEIRDVKFVRTLLSLDRKRMLCLYSAPDADAVRAAQREAGMPVDRVWSFEALGMADLAS